MKIDDFLKEEMNWSDRDLEYRPVIGYLKVTELLQKWGKEQLTLTDVSQQRELLLAYEKSQYETTWWMSEAEATNRINDFLANNCG